MRLCSFASSLLAFLLCHLVVTARQDHSSFSSSASATSPSSSVPTLQTACSTDFRRLSDCFQRLSLWQEDDCADCYNAQVRQLTTTQNSCDDLSLALCSQQRCAECADCLPEMRAYHACRWNAAAAREHPCDGDGPSCDDREGPNPKTRVPGLMIGLAAGAVLAVQFFGTCTKRRTKHGVDEYWFRPPSTRPAYSGATFCLYFGIIAMTSVWVGSAIQSQADGCNLFDTGSSVLGDDTFCGTGSRNGSYHIIFISGCVTLPIMYVLFLDQYRKSALLEILREMDESMTVSDYLDQLYGARTASVTLCTSGWHHNARYKPGFSTTPDDSSSSSTLTTHCSFLQEDPIAFLEAVDQSMHLSQTDLENKGYRLFRVQAQLAIVGDELYEVQKETLKACIEAASEGHCEYCEFDERMILDCQVYKPSIVLWRDLSRKTVFLNPGFAFICHLLVIPALPYQIWAHSRIPKITPVVRKGIKTA